MPLPTLATGFDPAEPPILNGRRLRKGDPVQHYRYRFPGDGIYRAGRYVKRAPTDPTGEMVLVEFHDNPIATGPVLVALRNLERQL